MAHSCHIIVADNPAVIYASRRGTPDRILPMLDRFLQKFWQERETSGEHSDTPECLVAQIIVRLGFEFAEDDFSNLRVGVRFNPNVDYLYQVSSDRNVTVWIPQGDYRQNPEVGLAGCQPWQNEKS